MTSLQSPPASTAPHWWWAAAALLALAGTVLGLGLLPSDPAEGEAHRIALLHGPALWSSGALCLAMALLGALGLATGDGGLLLMASATVPTGALMSFIALWTGALHDRPVSGAWWSGGSASVIELLLLSLYLVLMGQKVTLGDPVRAERAGARVALVGCAALLVAGLVLRGGDEAPAVDTTAPWAMRLSMLLMAAAFCAHGVAACLMRTRSLLLEREAAARPSPRKRGPGA